ncbi:hypothetical protein MMC28_000694 [Mycoblastus sanguinarius]|nr:hypothetical protein [Mycoblastus sanguinarius]
MDAPTRERWRHQEKSLKVEDSHTSVRAPILPDDKLFDAASISTSTVTDSQHKRQQNGSAEPTAAYGQITSIQSDYEKGPGIINVKDELQVLCGPLLNYKGMSDAGSRAPTWHGSVLIVTKPGQRQPNLKLRYVDEDNANQDSERSHPVVNSGSHPNDLSTKEVQEKNCPGVKLYEDPVKAFWRFAVDLPLQIQEAVWEYSVANMHSFTFAVPAVSQSMRIMFHSCNGFSVGTDENARSGPALWSDVLRVHGQRPFHVMIGGGDQIYNDGVRVNGPLKPWTDIGNPKKRRDFPFDEELRAACDVYYFDHYVECYSMEPFATASGIPQINIWDDHGRFPAIWRNSWLELT